MSLVLRGFPDCTTEGFLLQGFEVLRWETGRLGEPPSLFGGMCFYPEFTCNACVVADSIASKEEEYVYMCAYIYIYMRAGDYGTTLNPLQRKAQAPGSWGLSRLLLHQGGDAAREPGGHGFRLLTAGCTELKLPRCLSRSLSPPPSLSLSLSLSTHLSICPSVRLYV